VGVDSVVAAMTAALPPVITVCALALAGWCLVPILRNRWASPVQFVGLGVLAVLMLVQAVIAVVRLIGGARPHEYATFIGYLLTSVVIPPLAAGMSNMEHTRWGAAIMAGGALVCAVVTIRLQQVWRG
jgi:hypothetical protein